MGAYYHDTVASLLTTSTDDIVNKYLFPGYQRDAYFELKMRTIESWAREIEALKLALSRIDGCSTWGIALEFTIPRRLGRIDAVLLVGQAILALEFKTEQVDSMAAVQVEDYSLDLLYFHSTSKGRAIHPIVVGADQTKCTARKQRAIHDNLQPTRFSTESDLATVLSEVAATEGGQEQLDIGTWIRGEYRPVPTVIEAAIGMFAEMKVDDIAKAGSDAQNLTATVDALVELVTHAATNNEKLVVFVTGVPGAGKTLAGLKLAHDSRVRIKAQSEVTFLSGNGPLVTVLRAALTQDSVEQLCIRRRLAARDPKTLIQGVYQFKNDAWTKDAQPPEHVLIYDEAQRAWDQKTNVRKLRSREDGKTCGFSEPALLLSVLDRHKWAVMVALIGGGQEIHTGEAGLDEWGRAIHDHFRHWHVVSSPAALDGGAGAGSRLFTDRDPTGLSIMRDPRLHLDKPTRQFRGKAVAAWADAVLHNEITVAVDATRELLEYPIALTRDLAVAKKWVRRQAKGSERYGLIASSGGKRLRADGVHVPEAGADGVEHWFLKPPSDVRSSYQLEVAATEFQCQGLEVEWAIVCWSGDLIRDGRTWQLREFIGTEWRNINPKRKTVRAYLENTYRVLLTRARQGIVIFVPRGSLDDPTRCPAEFDRTAAFLLEAGAQPIDAASAVAG